MVPGHKSDSMRYWGDDQKMMARTKTDDREREERTGGRERYDEVEKTAEMKLRGYWEWKQCWIAIQAVGWVHGREHLRCRVRAEPLAALVQ